MGSAEQSHNGSSSQIWLDAERYRLSEVNDRFIAHPEGLPALARNCIVVGHRGIGKTMVLKKLCFDLRTRTDVKPIYINIEQWLGKVTCEAVYPVPQHITPREKDLITCTRFLVCLALLHGCDQYCTSIVEVGASMLPRANEESMRFNEVMDVHLAVLRRVIERGAELPEIYHGCPSPFELANALGEAASESGFSLVFLIDQVDKLPGPHFHPVGSLLRRGAHVVVIGARPHPCAPDAIPALGTITPGNDYDTHRLGRDHRAESWRAFIRDVVTLLGLDPRTIDALHTHAQTISALAGPSVRSVLQLGLELQRHAAQGISPPDALSKAILARAAEERLAAETVLGGYCGDARGFINNLRTRCLKTRQQNHKGPGPGRMDIQKGSNLFLPLEVASVLRVATREGILIPGPTEAVGIDTLADSYEVSPLLLVPEDVAALAAIDTDVEHFDVYVSELTSWVARRRSRSSRTSQVAHVFVPYWMSSPKTEGSLPTLLREQLLGKAHIRTGEDLHRYDSPQWSAEIRGLVRCCSLMVVDLSVPRRDVFVEWGWAIAYNKPVILACENRAQVKGIPQWASERNIHPYGDESEMDRLLARIVEMLDSPPDRIQRWKDDPENDPMDMASDAKTIGVAGAGTDYQAVVDFCNSVTLEQGCVLKTMHIRDDPHQGGILFDAIRMARECSTLVLVFDGTAADLLTCIIGGTFSGTDNISLAKTRRKKLLCLLNASREGDDTILPGLLRTKPGVRSYHSVPSLNKEARLHMIDINNWVRGIDKTMRAKGQENDG